MHTSLTDKQTNKNKPAQTNKQTNKTKTNNKTNKLNETNKQAHTPHWRDSGKISNYNRYSSDLLPPEACPWLMERSVETQSETVYPCSVYGKISSSLFLMVRRLFGVLQSAGPVGFSPASSQLMEAS
jgi:hypothetical protein